MQNDIPPAISYIDGVVKLPSDGSMPLFPEGFDTLPPEQQDVVRIHHRYACRQRMWILLIPSFDPFWAHCSLLPHISELNNLVPLITHCVCDGPHDLCAQLIVLQQSWADIADCPCPIDFTEEEIAVHEKEAGDLKEHYHNVTRLRDAIGCSNDGSVPLEEFEAAKEKMEHYRGLWDETEMKGPFPLYEGAPSYYLD